MQLTRRYHRAFFRARAAVLQYVTSPIRKLFYIAQGMKVGTGTLIPKILITFPHTVSIGSRCRIEPMVYFHYDGPYSNNTAIAIGDNCFIGTGTEFNISQSITIGNDCLIASGCRFVDHDHGMSMGVPMRLQPTSSDPIIIGSDVWIGANAVLLKGISVGEGAIIAAGSVVTKSVPAFHIAAGVPARILRKRGDLQGGQ